MMAPRTSRPAENAATAIRTIDTLLNDMVSPAAGPAGSSCDPSAIYENRRTGHVRRSAGRQEHDRAGQLVELTPAAHRNLRDELLVLHRIVEQLTIHLGGKCTRADRI